MCLTIRNKCICTNILTDSNQWDFNSLVFIFIFLTINVTKKIKETFDRIKNYYYFKCPTSAAAAAAAANRFWYSCCCKLFVTAYAILCCGCCCFCCCCCCWWNICSWLKFSRLVIKKFEFRLLPFREGSIGLFRATTGKDSRSGDL